MTDHTRCRKGRPEQQNVFGTALKTESFRPCFRKNPAFPGGNETSGTAVCRDSGFPAGNLRQGGRFQRHDERIFSVGIKLPAKTGLLKAEPRVQRTRRHIAHAHFQKSRFPSFGRQTFFPPVTAFPNFSTAVYS